MTLETLPQPRAVPADTHAGQRILVVDSDKTLVDSLSRRFGQQGFRTRTAPSGHEGLRLAHSEPFDLILVDVRLPDTDGLSVCRKLGEAPDTCGIPVIILSSMARPDIIRCRRTDGCYYLVRKPCDSAALTVLIRQAIKESEGWDPATE